MSELFISDLHFGHENVLNFEPERKLFANTVEEMDEELLRRFNAKGDPGDLVYVVGDLFWSNKDGYAAHMLRRMNKQIFLVIGNHDRCIKDGAVKKLLAGYADRKQLNVKLKDGTTRQVMLDHYFHPFYHGHRYNGILLHGHSHNTEEAKDEKELIKLINDKGYNLQSYNVGACYQDYEPKYLDEILMREELS